jgi:hypothetical protein
MENRILERDDIFALLDWKTPNEGYFPNIDLTVCNDIGPRRREVSIHSRADAVDRLPDINRHIVQVTKHIAAYLVCKGAHRFAAVG